MCSDQLTWVDVGAVTRNYTSHAASLAACILYILTRSVEKLVHLRPAGAGLFGVNFLLDLFRESQAKERELRKQPRSLRSVCCFVDWTGHLTTTVGFGMLAAGSSAPVGCTLVAVGLVVKMVVLVVGLYFDGLAKVFGSDRAFCNVFFRIIMIGCFGTAGAVLLTGGAFVGLSDPVGALLDTVGAFLIACGVLVGTVEVAFHDAKDLGPLQPDVSYDGPCVASADSGLSSDKLISAPPPSL